MVKSVKSPGFFAFFSGEIPIFRGETVHFVSETPRRLQLRCAELREELQRQLPATALFAGAAGGTWGHRWNGAEYGWNWLVQWIGIGLRENLQETMVFPSSYRAKSLDWFVGEILTGNHGKITIRYGGFRLKFSLKPIHWRVVLTILKNMKINGKDDIP